MRILLIFSLLICGSLTGFTAEINVATTYPYIQSIVEQVGGERVTVRALAGGDWDPHVVVPKPSYIAKLRAADLLVMSGAQLEIGWLPALMHQASNPKINIGSKGLLDLSGFVSLIEIPSGISRAQGDIHPEGNPHFYLDPENIPLLSKAIADRLSELDPQGKSTYQYNNQLFTGKWKGKLAEWNTKLTKIRGVTVIEYHKLFDYFLHRYDLNLLGTVETLPGIPPTSRHIAELEQIIAPDSVAFILQDVYHPDGASKLLAEKFSIRLVTLPHDVGAVSEATDIFNLFDEITRRLSND